MGAELAEQLESRHCHQGWKGGGAFVVLHPLAGSKETGPSAQSCLRADCMYAQCSARCDSGSLGHPITPMSRGLARRWCAARLGEGLGTLSLPQLAQPFRLSTRARDPDGARRDGPASGAGVPPVHRITSMAGRCSSAASRPAAAGVAMPRRARPMTAIVAPCRRRPCMAVH